MKLIWTKSSLPLSKLIRWGLKEPVNHFVYLCTQLAASLPGWLIPCVKSIPDLGITSPYMLYKIINSEQ